MSAHVITVEGSTASFSQQGKDTVLRAALRAGVGFPYECNSGGCGSCKFELLSGEVEELWPAAPALNDRDRRRNRMLACQSRAKSDLHIKVRTASEYLARHAPTRRTARFVGSSDLTHDIREFRFLTQGWASFLPGQYVCVDIPGVTEPRAYSMSNLPNAAGEWNFQVRRVPSGKVTTQLFDHLQPGSEVEIDGPYGLAWLRLDSERDIVCVAGGAGLAPMVSIACGSAAAGMLGTRHLHFFYGARTSRDVCGEACLRALPEFGKRIHFHPVLSAPHPDDAWSGETGWVHEAVGRRLDGRLAEFEYYFAGPPPMTEALQNLLMVGHRVPYAQIHFDRFF